MSTPTPPTPPPGYHGPAIPQHWGALSGPIVHFDYPGDDGETLARRMTAERATSA